jgi:hypothetical protein
MITVECTAVIPVKVAYLRYVDLLNAIELIDHKDQVVLTIKSHKEWCDLTKTTSLGVDLKQAYDKMREFGWV